MEADDNRHVGCGKGDIIVDLVHRVGVIARDAPERVDGRDELTLEGVDCCVLLIGGYHRQVTVNRWRERAEPPLERVRSISEGGSATHHTYVGKVRNQKLGTTGIGIDRGTCVAGVAFRSVVT